MRPALRLTGFVVLLSVLHGAALTAENEPARSPLLLRIRSYYGNLTGPYYWTEVLVLTGGAVSITASCGPDGRPIYLRSTVGVLAPPVYAALSQALSANRVGGQSGQCGSSPRGHVQWYDVTWFGRNGRTSQFLLRAFPNDCPAAQLAIVQAILNALAAREEVPVPAGFGDLADCNGG